MRRVHSVFRVVEPSWNLSTGKLAFLFRLTQELTDSTFPTAQSCGTATGGQKKRFSDHVKTILRKCSVSPDQLEALAADREAWRDVCEEGLAAFDTNYDQETEARRVKLEQRKTALSTTIPSTFDATKLVNFGPLPKFLHR